jgi:hypothetical protein
MKTLFFFILFILIICSSTVISAQVNKISVTHDKELGVFVTYVYQTADNYVTLIEVLKNNNVVHIKFFNTKVGFNSFKINTIEEDIIQIKVTLKNGDVITSDKLIVK